METRAINPQSVPASQGSYAHGIVTDGATRTLFISGQIPVTGDGTVPDGFEDQGRAVWRNIAAVLNDAGMAIENLVKVTIYLSDRAYAGANRTVRKEFLGDHQPALTVVIAGIFDDAWLLEIEAIAQA